MPVAGREGANGSLRIVVRAQPEQREVEGGGPAFGSFDEQLDVVALEWEPLLVDEEGVGFCRRERQVVGAHFAEEASAAQTGERDRGVVAAGDEQSCVRRKPLDGTLD